MSAGSTNCSYSMGTANEQLVLDFIHAAYGERMDIDRMLAMVSDDFVYQLNVPSTPAIRGRDAVRTQWEKFSRGSTGMVDGSEILAIVSNDDTVALERIDVNVVKGTKLTFHMAAFFDIRDGKITCLREYWDKSDVERQ